MNKFYPHISPNGAEGNRIEKIRSAAVLLTALLFAASILAGCTRSSPGPSVEPSPTALQAVEAHPSTSAPATPSPSRETPVLPTPVAPRETTPTSEPTPDPVVVPPPRTQYTLNAQFDYNRHYVFVEQTVTYTHASGEPLDHLLLVVDANRVWQAFNLLSISWDDGRPVESYQIENDRLSVSLPQPLSYLDSVAIRLTYELNLPAIPPPSEATRPAPFGYTARQTNLVDWYPFLPPYREGEGWSANEAWFFGEHQVYEKADFEVTLEMISPPSTLVVAASAPQQQDGDRYTFRHENARNFAMSISHFYQVFSEKVGSTTVSSYAFPYDVAPGEVTLKDTVAAVELYNRLFGPYPHPQLSVVEADFLDGMEYDGLYFLSRGFYNIYDGTPQGYLTMIAVHETAHQWWYGLVANDQAFEPWLDEALCTYSELLFYEHTYPELVDWWWSYRVSFYQPLGWVDGSIYAYNGFLSYRDSVYLRGAIFLHELRSAMGDEAFFAFLQDYVARFSHQIATGDDFFAVLAEHTSIDVLSIQEQYFNVIR